MYYDISVPWLAVCIGTPWNVSFVLFPHNRYIDNLSSLYTAFLIIFLPYPSSLYTAFLIIFLPFTLLFFLFIKEEILFRLCYNWPSFLQYVFCFLLLLSVILKIFVCGFFHSYLNTLKWLGLSTEAEGNTTIHLCVWNNLWLVMHC